MARRLILRNARKPAPSIITRSVPPRRFRRRAIHKRGSQVKQSAPTRPRPASATTRIGACGRAGRFALPEKQGRAGPDSKTADKLGDALAGTPAAMGDQVDHLPQVKNRIVLLAQIYDVFWQARHGGAIHRDRHDPRLVVVILGAFERGRQFNLGPAGQTIMFGTQENRQPGAIPVNRRQNRFQPFTENLSRFLRAAEIKNPQPSGLESIKQLLGQMGGVTVARRKTDGHVENPGHRTPGDRARLAGP